MLDNSGPDLCLPARAGTESATAEEKICWIWTEPTRANVLSETNVTEVCVWPKGGEENGRTLVPGVVTLRLAALASVVVVLHANMREVQPCIQPHSAWHTYPLPQGVVLLLLLLSMATAARDLRDTVMN